MEEKKGPNIKIAPPAKPSGLPNLKPTNISNGVKFTSNVQSKPITKLDLKNNKENKTIVKQEKINKSTSAPKSRKIKALVISIAAIVVLSLLTVLVYFAFVQPTLPMKININFTTETHLSVDDGQGGAPQGPKEVMPGDNIDCTYLIKSESVEGELAGDVYVRLTAYALCEGNYYSDIFSFYFNDNNWYKANDGYYYYTKILEPDTSIDAVKYLHINETVGSEFAGKTVTVNFIAEALQVSESNNSSIDAMWPTAPQEWTDMVR